MVWSDFLKYESDQKYDVIIMGDILEHVSEPISALKKARDNSAFTRMKKFTDAMWNQKNHFAYFSYETFLPFLKENGFDVKRYDISNRYNGSMELFCVGV